jgi:hypothetical protein
LSLQRNLKPYSISSGDQADNSLPFRRKGRLVGP